MTRKKLVMVTVKKDSVVVNHILIFVAGVALGLLVMLITPSINSFTDEDYPGTITDAAASSMCMGAALVMIAIGAIAFAFVQSKEVIDAIREKRIQEECD